MKSKTLVLLLSIVILASYLRFYQLGSNPPSLTWDEVAWGYNAYALGIDGKDEFGKFLPLTYLESFGDFKPPLYAYLTILPVKVFGLTEFAVRFASAFFGVLTVLVTFFLTKRIFYKSPHATHIALAAEFVMSISPWHINLSRAAFEANVTTFFLASGVFMFLGGVQGKKWYLVGSAVAFALSFYTFNTARIVAPLLVLALAVGFFKILIKQKKESIISGIVGVILLLPLLPFLFSPQASLRFKEVNIFSDIGPVERANTQIANDNNAFWSKIIHNRRFAYAREYLHHYFDNLNPHFLFIKGDGNPKFSTRDVGQLYLLDIPFLIIGLVLLFRKREGSWWIIPAWLLIGIAPAAVARETPHALRIEATLPTFQILVAYGIIYTLFVNEVIKSKRVRIFLASGAFLLLFLNFLYYIHGYHTHYPRTYSGEWQYGYKDSISYAAGVKDAYDAVFITDALGRPYVYYAFFTKEDPKSFRKLVKAKRDVFGFVTVDGFSKYHFAKDIHAVKADSKNILYINTPDKVPDNATVLEVFTLKDGKPVFVAYTL